MQRRRDRKGQKKKDSLKRPRGKGRSIGRRSQERRSPIMCIRRILFSRDWAISGISRYQSGRRPGVRAKRKQTKNNKQRRSARGRGTKPQGCSRGTAIGQDMHRRKKRNPDTKRSKAFRHRCLFKDLRANLYPRFLYKQNSQLKW